MASWMRLLCPHDGATNLSRYYCMLFDSDESTAEQYFTPAAVIYYTQNSDKRVDAGNTSINSIY